LLFVFISGRIWCSGTDLLQSDRDNDDALRSLQAFLHPSPVVASKAVSYCRVEVAGKASLTLSASFSSDEDIEEQEEYYRPTAFEGISGSIVYLTSSALYIMFGVVLMYVVYAVEKGKPGNSECEEKRNSVNVSRALSLISPSLIPENNKWSDRLFAHHPFLMGFLILCFLIACIMEGLKLAPGAFKVYRIV